MISSNINEFNVFTDQLEDEGIDVSLMRLLCIYNYFPSIISMISLNDYTNLGNEPQGDGRVLVSTLLVMYDDCGESYFANDSISRQTGYGITPYNQC